MNLPQYRRITSSTIRAAFRADPVAAQAELAEFLLPRAIKQLRAAVDRSEAWAIRTVFELARFLAAPQQVLIMALFQNLGVQNETEALALVGQGRKLAQLGEITPEAAGDNAVESLRVVIPHSSPETRRRWAGALAGLWSEAEAVQDAPGSTITLEPDSDHKPETNGHGRAT